jgi:spermidine/putrescine transport system permease protein
MHLRQRILRLTPYLLLAPGILWLLVFYVYPSIQMFISSFWSGSLETGYTVSLSNWTTYADAIDRYGEQFLRSIVYGAAATVICFLIAYPLAYTIAFRGGRYKSLLLFLVIAPFFTSFLLRTQSWKIILGDDGILFGPLKDLGVLPEEFRVLATPVAVVAGIAYNFLPFMTLPIYANLERLDLRLIEAGEDLYANPAETFRRVTLPLSMPGIVAGSLLTFIPAAGDYVNSALLGTASTAMIGNVIDSRFFRVVDYPTAAALSVLLMAAILLLVAAYVRRSGTDDLL